MQTLKNDPVREPTSNPPFAEAEKAFVFLGGALITARGEQRPELFWHAFDAVCEARARELALCNHKTAQIYLAGESAL
jgi:hypothetical protein